MTNFFSKEETVTIIAGLTEIQLESFIEAEIVMPVHTDTGLAFRRLDLVRMELLCELSDHFSLDEEGLGIVISLVDQLHGARAELRTIFAALEDAPTDVRTKVAKALANIRFGD